MKKRLIATVVTLALLAGCASENKYERKADDITRAVMNNDLKPVMNEISPTAHITRVQVAAWSDELDEQGKLQSVKQVTDNCETGVYCFTVTFEKSKYNEKMRLDDHDQITDWAFHQAVATGS